MRKRKCFVVGGKSGHVSTFDSAEKAMFSGREGGGVGGQRPEVSGESDYENGAENGLRVKGAWGRFMAH
jgi:hypothetical protein